jgi:hypothetical protein
MWGQPVVVETAPAPAAARRLEFVLRSDPDGYAQLANSSAHAAGRHLQGHALRRSVTS